MRVTREQRDAWAANTATGAFNRWLDKRVRDDSGAFDLDRLYVLAERYGVQKRAEYAHLNPGQQRMNVGNILRRLVPPSEYEWELIDVGVPAGSGLPLAESLTHKSALISTV